MTTQIIQQTKSSNQVMLLFKVITLLTATYYLAVGIKYSWEVASEWGATAIHEGVDRLVMWDTPRLAGIEDFDITISKDAKISLDGVPATQKDLVKLLHTIIVRHQRYESMLARDKAIAAQIGVEE